MNLKLRLLFVFVIVILIHEITSKQQLYPSLCLLPMKMGPCRADIPRYAYNSASGQCEQFIYGGCHANANNFKTMSECEMTCKTI
ncbi:PREDICTED: PI-actitoxin-Afv2b-like [Trachymyrmex septentrionalis]|uniref:PI-actitoxin-Afv2b-like n=1 Tax=Trachymyrmex septentrionalis TaxID=34720 RepID=UPI00084ED23A|nr:PREDICTED: PI-actitoxin-Afv2b-like [Trachymyrmex septentrionalis]